MSVNNLLWNKVRYGFYAPFYNVIEGFVAEERRKSISLLDLKPGDEVLIQGAGTGLDLDFIPQGVNITAIDLSASMVARCQNRAKSLGLSLHAETMDAANLAFDENRFDAVILHLILAVLPDPFGCAKETARVLKPQGRVCVFDKFLADDKSPTLFRKSANLFSNLFFTDINRQLGPILNHAELKVVQQHPSLLGGMFQIALVEPKSRPTFMKSNSTSAG